MKSLIIFNCVNFSNPRILPSIFLFHFTSMSRENPRLLNFRRGRCPFTAKKLKLCSPRACSASESVGYGGWDDLGQVGDMAIHGESDRLRSFLVSVGVDDKQHVFMFFLGLLCAFSISRIRVSSVVVFPASVLLFAIGFSFGFVRGGSFSEITTKRRSKEEALRISPEKFRGLVDFFDGFDVNVSNLKNDVQRAIDASIITVGDLENYVNVMENLRLSASNARNVVQASTDNVGNSDSVLENQKPNRRKKEPADRGFDILQFVGSLFPENSVSLKHDKVKENNIKQATMESPTNDKTRENISSPSTREKVSNSLPTDNEGNAISSFLQDSSHQSYSYLSRRIRMDLENGRINSEVLGDSSKRYTDSYEDNFLDNSRSFVNDHHVSLKMRHSNETRTWEAHGNLLDSMDLRTETRASFLQEQSSRNSSETYKSSARKEKTENRLYGSRFRKTHKDDPNLLSHLPTQDGEINLSSSSQFANDELFNRYLTEANDLLQEAKELIRGRYDEGQAEMILGKSAHLLSKAIALKPMSLLAVGQLGNTYLLHGELKLHVSRELRVILSKNDATFVDEHRRTISRKDHQFESRDEITSVLINVCEECEELLVKAGRKYKLALSIDRNDVRALYNWGLALSFRAQLISDIGPEAALDADKVFMAAIDKFDAMMSKGNNYAPDALFRWGVALQQRSRLRPSNSKEKVKLLEQAKRLYEDALDMDSENRQVREALSSCISELNYRNF